MGNNSSQNDDFSKTPNFDISQHNQAMRNLQGNYSEAQFNIHTNNYYQPKVSESEFKTIHRSCSIYKPTINIHMQPNQFSLEFEYDSDQGNKLEIYPAVRTVKEEPDTKITISIDSQLFYQQFLAAGKKAKFQRTYPLNGSKMSGSTLILRIISTTTDEKTQYSIKHTGKQQWKILLQKLQFNGIVTQLDNIYKGGSEGEDCIICFTQKVNTLIEPCNHLCLCFECSEQVKKSTNNCPVCRTHIKSFKKIRST